VSKVNICERARVTIKEHMRARLLIRREQHMINHALGLVELVGAVERRVFEQH